MHPKNTYVSKGNDDQCLQTFHRERIHGVQDDNVARSSCHLLDLAVQHVMLGWVDEPQCSDDHGMQHEDELGQFFLVVKPSPKLRLVKQWNPWLHKVEVRRDDVVEELWRW